MKIVLSQAISLLSSMPDKTEATLQGPETLLKTEATNTSELNARFEQRDWGKVSTLPSHPKSSKADG